MILWPAAKIQILPLAKKFTGTGKEIDAYVTSVNFVMLLHMSKCKPCRLYREDIVDVTFLSLYVPTRASLAVETKGLLFLWLAHLHLNNKSNVCKHTSSVTISRLFQVVLCLSTFPK